MLCRKLNDRQFFNAVTVSVRACVRAFASGYYHNDSYDNDSSINTLSSLLLFQMSVLYVCCCPLMYSFSLCLLLRLALAQKLFRCHHACCGNGHASGGACHLMMMMMMVMIFTSSLAQFVSILLICLHKTVVCDTVGR